ncbi:MAG: efflux RND transporter periplasmic adaptor subunit [Myxococcota bacterium]
MWIGVFVLWLVACGGSSGPPSGNDLPVDDPVSVVEIGQASLGDVAEFLTSSAVVESEASADLVPEATGIVRRILKDEGDPVSRGDLLAVLDNVSLGTGAESAAAEVTKLTGQVAEAEALFSQGAISSREFEDLRFQLEQAQRSAREATRSYGSTRLTAPFDGVVAQRTITVGELATSATPAFQVVDPTRLRVVTSIPERDLGRIKLDQPTRLVSAYDDRIGTTGKVQRIAPVVDSTSGTFRVTISVDDPTKLLPGQFVTVQIIVDRRENVLTIPKEALLYQEGRPIVFTLGPLPEEEPEEEEAETKKTNGGWFGGKAEQAEEAPKKVAVAPPSNVAVRRPIELGLIDEATVQVIGGLTDGETIITLGHTHLRDGAKIRITEPPSSAQEPGPENAAELEGSKG